MSREIKLCLVYRDMWQSSGKFMPNGEQLEKIAEPIINMGCWDRIETNGGGFEQIQLLAGENPNKVLRKWAKPFNEAKIKTQMLERGLNALSMSPVSKDVRKLMFNVKKSQGTNISRSFDGLNDIRNLKYSIEYSIDANMISQSCLCITHSNIHTVEYYINLAKALINMGTNEIAIKDMAGIGRPTSLGKIVRGIKNFSPKTLVQYHGHSGPGFSVASSLEVARAGADIIDVAMEPLSWGTTHADLLTIHEVLKDDGFIVKDINMNGYRDVKNLTQEFIDEKLGYFINPKNRFMNSLLIESGLPGGMMGSLMSDLEKSLLSLNNWLNKKDKDPLNINLLFSMLLDEVKSIWPIMGYPPLVTPYSQYVKNVALGNVMLGIKGKEKWGLVDDNTWDMLLGKSGKLPGSLGKEINNLALKLNKSFYTDEPQNLYPDKLEDLKIEMKEKGWALGKDNEELLEFALHKNQYIDYKSGKAKESFNQLIEKSKKTLIKDDNIDSKNHKVNSTIIELDDSKYKVDYIIDNSKNKNKNEYLSGIEVLSPLEGKFYLNKNSNQTQVKIGDQIKKGDTICYIESMKVINSIKSEHSGKIVQICFENGQEVFDDDILFILN